MILDDELKNSCFNAASVNKNNLLRLLKDNRDTIFGQKYSFSEITDIDGYRRTVPLSDYDTFRPYIEKMYNGEKMQLTAYEIYGYCHTSGTTNEPKYIPLSDVELERYSDCFERYQSSVVKRTGGKSLFINTFRTYPHKVAETPLLLSELYYKNIAEKGMMDMDTFIGGEELLFDPSPQDNLFAKAWMAILEENITVIESMFMYDQLNFFGYLEENHKKITNAIHTGKIPGDINLSETLEKKLLTAGYSEARLVRVESEFEKGFENIAKRLWPRLALLSGISNRAFSAEDAALARYVGDISKFYFCYSASECCMGFPYDENRFDYVLIPPNAFFELLPYDAERETDVTVLPHEAKVGELYEIVITNFAGLYRYRMGDIVQVTGFVGQSPIIEFEFRRNQALNIAGEKMDIRQLESAIAGLSEYAVKPSQYCFGASWEKMPGRYLVAVVLDDSSRRIEEEELSDLLDRLLMEHNSDYRDLRELKQLGRLEAVTFDQGNYICFLEENGLSSGHNKPKHIAYKGFSERRFSEWKRMGTKKSDLV